MFVFIAWCIHIVCPTLNPYLVLQRSVNVTKRYLNMEVDMTILTAALA